MSFVALVLVVRIASSPAQLRDLLSSHWTSSSWYQCVPRHEKILTHQLEILWNLINGKFSSMLSKVNMHLHCNRKWSSQALCWVTSFALECSEIVEVDPVQLCVLFHLCCSTCSSPPLFDGSSGTPVIRAWEASLSTRVFGAPSTTRLSTKTWYTYQIVTRMFMCMQQSLLTRRLSMLFLWQDCVVSALWIWQHSFPMSPLCSFGQVEYRILREHIQGWGSAGSMKECCLWHPLLLAHKVQNATSHHDTEPFLHVDRCYDHGLSSNGNAWRLVLFQCTFLRLSF